MGVSLIKGDIEWGGEISAKTRLKLLGEGRTIGALAVPALYLTSVAGGMPITGTEIAPITTREWIRKQGAPYPWALASLGEPNNPNSMTMKTAFDIRSWQATTPETKTSGFSVSGCHHRYAMSTGNATTIG